MNQLLKPIKKNMNTPAQNQAETEIVERTAEQLHRVLPEFLDSYVLIGRCPLTGRAIARYWAPTDADAVDLNELLRAMAQNGLQ